MAITLILLCAALAMGALCDLLLVVFAKDRRAALVARWRQPQLFLPGVLPRFRRRLAEVLLWVGLALLLAEETVQLLLEQFAPAVPLDKLAVLWSALLCLTVVGRAVCLPFSLRQLACLAPVFLLVALILRATWAGSYAYLVAQPVCLLVFFLGAPLRRVLAVSLGILSGHMVLTVGLFWAGRLPDHWAWIGDVPRQALGFGHFNILGLAVMELVLLYMLLRFSRWGWKDTALTLGAGAFVWFVPRSRTAALAIILLLALVLLGRYLPRLLKLRPVRAGLTVCWPVCAALSLLGGTLYPDFPLAGSLNDLLSGRLFLMHQQLLGPPVRWLGAVINGSMTWAEAYDPAIWEFERLANRYNYNFVDNGYAFCLFMAGPLWLILLCVGYSLLIHRLLKGPSCDWPLAFVLILYAVYSLSERTFAEIWAVMLLGNLVAARPLTLARTCAPPDTGGQTASRSSR